MQCDTLYTVMQVRCTQCGYVLLTVRKAARFAVEALTLYTVERTRCTRWKPPPFSVVEMVTPSAMRRAVDGDQDPRADRWPPSAYPGRPARGQHMGLWENLRR